MPASGSSVPSQPSTQFNPPSDANDPATARAPVNPRSTPAYADPMDATGSDPYSANMSAPESTPGFKRGGFVRRGYGRARGA
jgi:hypothetical protein